MSGGGGSSNQPTNTTVTQTSIPEYARPYVERALGQAAALTDINQNPYEAYSGDRFAQFTPLQQQAFEGAYGMKPSSQLGTATGMATMAGLGAMGAGASFDPYKTGQFTGATAAGYMSPYMQNVVDVQQQQAQRQADIANQAAKAQFAQAGAFGGGRAAIQQGQAAADLARQKQNIQAQGQQQAFQQAQQQFNQEQQLREQSRQYGAGLGMQGLQTGLQAAGQLGQLGQQQFQQGMDINKLQQQYGTQQQSQVQNILNAQYQDYLNARQYPYQQLGFMSDILRGLPLSQTYSQAYQQPPSMLGQLAGIGMGAYSLAKKDGGSVHSYADGGLSSALDFAQRSEPVMRMAYGGDVTSDQFVEGAIRRLSDSQLMQARQLAAMRGDRRRVEEIDSELQERSAIKSYGQGEAEGMRVGGVVSFKEGGDKGEESGGVSPWAYLLTAAPAIKEAVSSGASALRGIGSAVSGVPGAVGNVLGSAGRTYLGVGETAMPAAAVLAGGTALSSAARGTLKANPILQEDLGEVGGGLSPDFALAAAIQREGKKSDEAKAAKKAEVEATAQKVGTGRGISEAYKNYDAAAAAEALAKVPMRKDEPASNLSSNEKTNAKLVSNAMARATGTSSTDMMGNVQALYEWLKEGDKQMFDAVNARIDDIKKEAADVKAGAKDRALAEFGFKMAATAAQPGVGGGLAGALRSAAAAAPTITESMAKSEDLRRRLLDTTNKLEIANLQARQQAMKGDKQAAVQFANMARQLEAQQAQLAETIRHNQAVEKLTGERYAASERAQGIKLAQLPLQARKQAAYELNNELKLNPMLLAELKESGKTVEQLIKERADVIQQSPLLNVISNLRTED